MTNTLYFHNTIRGGDRGDDSFSTTTTEESPAASRRHIDTPFDHHHHQHQQQQPGVVPAPPPPWIAGFNAWIPTPSGFNPESENSDDSSEISFPGSITPTRPSEGGQFSKRFSYKELRSATEMFHIDRILGKGSFGRVFIGWIDENKLTATESGEGTAVAIKRIRQHSFQGHHEWWTEVKCLGKLCHPNLTRLFGYCVDNEERLLVYEFMPRGSLENRLFGRNASPLSWSVRMKIALGVAKGLAFLHSPAVNVIHRDVKGSNILLDMDYNTKLSDFSLAVDGPAGDEKYISTCVMGTIGYTAPDYIATGHVTAKSDVYSFGVVLLEILSGRRVLDKSRPTREYSLVEWANPYLNQKRKIYRVLDSRLEGQYTLDGARKVAKLAHQCLSKKGKLRPNMDDVVKALEEH